MSPTPAAPLSVFDSTTLGPLRLRNRFVKAATFEGMSPGGIPSPRLAEFHGAFAAGGVALSTVAYCAVDPGGRTYADQIWLRPAVRKPLQKVTDAIHRGGAYAAAQLGHSGYFANPRESGERGIAPSRVFSPYGLSFPRAFRTEDFERVAGLYAEAARIAVDSGFDALELHLGHGYLLSQFLSPHTNRRRDGWGGSIENRARFPRQVAQAVRDAVGPSIALWGKLNMTDGFRGGLTEDDALRAAQMLERDGCLDALQLTSGFTSRTPMLLLRGEVPLRDLIQYEPDRLRRVGMRLMAGRFLRRYPFEEWFHRAPALRFRHKLTMPLMALGGLTRLDTMNQAVHAGFQFIALARALLREPALVERFRRGELDASPCTPCNRCITEMRRYGTRCVERPEWGEEA